MPRAALFGLLLASVVRAQPAPRLELDLGDHPPRYLLGEPIRLGLRFTAPPGLGLHLLLQRWSRAGRVNWGHFSAAPAARDPLARLYARRAFPTGGAVDDRPLSDEPVRVELDLNEYLVFDRPGRYRVRFACRANVRQAPHDRDWLPAPLPEQEFELEILPRDRPAVQEELRAAAWRQGPDADHRAAMRRLRFLNSQLAVDELLAGVLSNDAAVQFEALAGLYGLADACTVLERVRNAPPHEQLQRLAEDLAPGCPL